MGGGELVRDGGYSCLLLLGRHQFFHVLTVVLFADVFAVLLFLVGLGRRQRRAQNVVGALLLALGLRLGPDRGGVSVLVVLKLLLSLVHHVGLAGLIARLALAAAAAASAASSRLQPRQTPAEESAIALLRSHDGS